MDVPIFGVQMHVIVSNATYDSNTLRPMIFGMMEAMGGEKIGSGSRVLIKPNLLSPALPRQASPQPLRFWFSLL